MGSAVGSAAAAALCAALWDVLGEGWVNGGLLVHLRKAALSAGLFWKLEAAFCSGNDLLE